MNMKVKGRMRKRIPWLVCESKSRQARLAVCSEVLGGRNHQGKSRVRIRALQSQAAWFIYAIAKRYSRNPDLRFSPFLKGRIRIGDANPSFEQSEDPSNSDENDVFGHPNAVDHPF